LASGEIQHFAVWSAGSNK